MANKCSHRMEPCLSEGHREQSCRLLLVLHQRPHVLPHCLASGLCLPLSAQHAERAPPPSGDMTSERQLNRSKRAAHRQPTRGRYCQPCRFHCGWCGPCQDSVACGGRLVPQTLPTLPQHAPSWTPRTLMTTATLTMTPVLPWLLNRSIKSLLMSRVFRTSWLQETSPNFLLPCADGHCQLGRASPCSDSHPCARAILGADFDTAIEPVLAQAHADLASPATRSQSATEPSRQIQRHRRLHACIHRQGSADRTGE